MVATLEKTVTIGVDRHISLNVTAPENVPPGNIQVVLLFLPGTAEGAEKRDGIVTAEQLKNLPAHSLRISSEEYNTPLDVREAQIMISANSGKNHRNKSFITYAGCLKDSALFKGDSVAIQKEMRSEWD